MANLPIFTRLTIRDYLLFPGAPEGAGIDYRFKRGVTLIAGINGLGKTTLITILLRLLTGPNDLSGAGMPQSIGSTLPAEPARLRSDTLRFFSQRVGDEARDATASLEASFDGAQVLITRHLRTLQLTEFKINNVSRLGDEDAEKNYQERMCGLVDVSSFVDVLLLLHFIVFFSEFRAGALWDLDAQRHLMRALFLPKATAAKVAELERQVGSADSAARNLQSILTPQEKRLIQEQELHSTEPGVRAELQSLRTLLDADLERRAALEARRDELEAERRSDRLDLEKAKIEREESERALERLKFDALSRMFPKMEDSARLTILNLLSKGECLVCGANAEDARKELEDKLAHGICPVCSSPPERQVDVVQVRSVEAARVTRLRKRAHSAAVEENSKAENWTQINQSYDALIGELQALTNEIDDLQIKVRGLAAEMPLPSAELKELENHVVRLRKDVSAAKARRAEAAKRLRGTLKSVNNVVIENSDLLTEKFADYCGSLLSEEATLVRIEGESGLAQAEEQFHVPLFNAEMSAAARPGLTRRKSMQDVSESQRELMDLAFRFALTDVATQSADATLVMETPEASLDGIAMERVGKALHAFAMEGQNRLIATSNLSNAGIVAWLFGGPTKKSLHQRYARTIDLLEVSAQNRALQKDVRGRYPALLKRALAGRRTGA